MFDIGLSGLNAAAADLKVIGNNIANSSTPGFKQSRIDFMNVMASSLNSSSIGNVQNLSGTSASTISQEFTQGTINSTTNPLDVAIMGNGFFQLQDPNTNGVVYTRNGSFKLDGSGYIVNPAGDRLMGYPATSGVVTASAPAPININAALIPPTQTTTVELNLNLSSTSPVPKNTTFDPKKEDSYNFTSSVNVYNKQGAQQNLQLYFVKSATDTWNVYSTTTPTGGDSDGTTSTPQSLGALTFQADGTLAEGGGTFTGVMTDQGGDTTTLDLTGSTQMNNFSYVNSTSQNGFAAGSLNSFSINADGNIIGEYSNGQPNVFLGQVTVATFRSPTGLRDLGNTTWSATNASGDPSIGVAGTGNFGSLQSNALESSNVDQTTQLVALLAAQRVYQANAQTIQIENQVAQTMVTLGA